MSYAANDFTHIARRLAEIRREADTRLGATVPAPTDAAIRAPVAADPAEGWDGVVWP